MLHGIGIHQRNTLNGKDDIIRITMYPYIYIYVSDGVLNINFPTKTLMFSPKISFQLLFWSFHVSFQEVYLNIKNQWQKSDKIINKTQAFTAQNHVSHNAEPREKMKHQEGVHPYTVSHRAIPPILGPNETSRIIRWKPEKPEWDEQKAPQSQCVPTGSNSWPVSHRATISWAAPDCLLRINLVATKEMESEVRIHVSLLKTDQNINISWGSGGLWEVMKVHPISSHHVSQSTQPKKKKTKNTQWLQSSPDGLSHYDPMISRVS